MSHLVADSLDAFLALDIVAAWKDLEDLVEPGFCRSILRSARIVSAGRRRRYVRSARKRGRFRDWRNQIEQPVGHSLGEAHGLRDRHNRDPWPGHGQGFAIHLDLPAVRMDHDALELGCGQEPTQLLGIDEDLGSDLIADDGAIAQKNVKARRLRPRSKAQGQEQQTDERRSQDPLSCSWRRATIPERPR